VIKFDIIIDINDCFIVKELKLFCLKYLWYIRW